MLYLKIGIVLASLFALLHSFGIEFLPETEHHSWNSQSAEKQTSFDYKSDGEFATESFSEWKESQ